jgi:uncharacterized protein YkwD
LDNKKFILVFLIIALGTAHAQNTLQPNSAFEQRTIELINIERARHGLPPYLGNDALAPIARAHSGGALSTANISQRLRNDIATVTGHHVLTYNGNNTPEQMVTAWMNSSTARATILREDRTHIGVGITQSSTGSSARHSWSLIVINMIVLTPSEIQTFEMRVLELTNIERSRHGLPPLIWHEDLSDIARKHSEDLMRNNMRGHTGSDGSTVRVRIERAGITNTRALAENCSYGQRTPEEAVRAWMNSPGHRANILGNTTHLGVGLVLRSEGSSAQYVSYWTQVFASFR